MKLSIIVPFYNMDNTLHHCLDSLLQQSLDPGDYEILAVDDCSGDATRARLDDYQHRYPGRVRSLHTERNLRQGAARNVGLREAQGDWIGFMDGDDYAHPDMFRLMLEAAGEKMSAVYEGEASSPALEMAGGDGRDPSALPPVDVVSCGICEVTDYGFPEGKKRITNTPDQVGVLGDEEYRRLIRNPNSMVIKIYRRSIIEEQGLSFPEGIFYEDNAAAPIWLLHFKHMALVDEPLYYYVQLPGSTTHTITEDRCRDRMRAGDLLLELARDHGFLDRYREEFEAAFTKLYYVNTLFSYMPGVARVRIGFLQDLRRGMLRAFPDFRDNIYYKDSYDREEKKLIDMHISSPVLFMIYYKLLWAYRGFRRRLSG